MSELFLLNQTSNEKRLDNNWNNYLKILPWIVQSSYWIYIWLAYWTASYFSDVHIVSRVKWINKGIFSTIYSFIQNTEYTELLAPLVNMIKEGCENVSALLILLIFYLKIHLFIGG